MSWVAEHKSLIVVALFLAFSLWEVLAPVCKPTRPLIGRWASNVSLYILNSGLSSGLHLLPALLLAGWAEVAQQGLLNIVDVPPWLTWPVAIVVLDLAQYLFHRAMHRFTWLWRFHQIHHSDVDVDLTTSFRFHPVETLLWAAFHLSLVLVLGIPTDAILLYWLLVNVSNFFGHGNVLLPEPVDRMLLTLLITPSAHRLHHSVDYAASNSNFGNIFVLWDKWLKTYVYPAGEGQKGRLYGLAEFRHGRRMFVPWLLAVPFQRPAA